MQPLAPSSPSKPFRPHVVSIARDRLKDRGWSLTPALPPFFPTPLDSRACSESNPCVASVKSPKSPKTPNDLMVVVTSVGTEEQALDVAHALVRARRAACVNIIPNIHSIYRWKGRVCDDGE